MISSTYTGSQFWYVGQNGIKGVRLGIEGVESGNTAPRTGIKGECIRISYFFEGSDTCVPSLRDQGQNLLCFWNQGSEFWVQEMGSVLKKYTLKS